MTEEEPSGQSKPKPMAVEEKVLAAHKFAFHSSASVANMLPCG